MDNKELSFKNGLMKMNKKFDAKKYWKSFEILAVKVVKIQIKEIVKYEDLKFYVFIVYLKYQLLQRAILKVA